MKVYTKTGDDGTTGLFFAGRVPKDHPGPTAYGAVDEAVSGLGLARAETSPGDELHDLLVRLQRELFVVGAELATAPENRHKLQPGKYLVTAEMVEALEPVIDDVTARFEQPHEFVLPGQDRLSAALDLARTLVRRAERESVAAVHADWIPADSAVVPYLNRLSDLCWTLARWVEGDHLPSPEGPVSISITASATAPAKVRTDVLAVPIFEGGELGPGGDVVQAQLNGTLERYLTGNGYESKPVQTIAVPVTNGNGPGVVILVGLGARDQVTVETLRRAAAAAVRRASKASSLATTLVEARPESMSAAEAAQAVAEGLVLGSYEFLKYKPGGKPSPLQKVTVLGSTAAGVKDALARGQAIGEAVNLARDLVNEPGGALNAVDFATIATRVGRESGLKVTVLDEAAIKRLKLGGLLGVNRGSANAPRFVKLEYTPTGRRSGDVALVGKGITFDSGGLSLKTADGMETMKTDMSGAAAVLASMSTLKAVGSTVHVTGYIPLTDNMPSGTAIKPGDVLRIRNGKTVEVLNTDAEGRLVLADALSLAVEDRPEAIIDLATLTGAVTIALGMEIAGLFTSHDGWGRQVQNAANRAGEALWPLPLPESYRQQITSDVADIRNTGNARGGGAITAALFLREFAGDVPWVHLDIAGTARAGGDGPYTRKGGTGFGVRTLVELLTHYERPAARETGSGEPKAASGARKAPASKS